MMTTPRPQTNMTIMVTSYWSGDETNTKPPFSKLYLCLILRHIKSKPNFCSMLLSGSTNMLLSGTANMLLSGSAYMLLSGSAYMLPLMGHKNNMS